MTREELIVHWKDQLPPPEQPEPPKRRIKCD